MKDHDEQTPQERIVNDTRVILAEMADLQAFYDKSMGSLKQDLVDNGEALKQLKNKDSDF
ncbi:hypothetical protein [Mucilaginibacter agri]|uniref:Uncharacterized protein n=1 Tax=Mucilaginibacter agri TaxID=2695265 RepID=A0A965ZHI5_9SPHI|nr:hypothetical protein [Mucilaginibacter agri]NCD71130.1 hypothetical protein [Mucilaginibacter agri]